MSEIDSSDITIDQIVDAVAAKVGDFNRFEDAYEFAGQVASKFIMQADHLNQESESDEPFEVDCSPEAKEIFANQILFGAAKRAGEISANVDQVTGLPNRTLWDKRLQDAVDRIFHNPERRRLNRSYAVMFIDLDGFKDINDQHGHEGGDQALFNVAATLVDSTRREDIVARIGGDEFAVLMEVTGSSEEDIENKRDQIEQNLDTDFESTDGALITHSASVGLAQIRIDDSAANVLRRANQDMFVRKEAKLQRFPG